MAELSGDVFPVLLVRPVPPGRAGVAGTVLAAGQIPVGSCHVPGVPEPGDTVWELCDPATPDAPPNAVAVTRLRDCETVAEVIAAGVAPDAEGGRLLRRLLADVAAALRPAGCATLSARVAGSDQATMRLLVGAGFAHHPETHPGIHSEPHSVACDGAPAAGLARLPVEGAAAGSSPAGQRDVMWLMLEL